MKFNKLFKVFALISFLVILLSFPIVAGAMPDVGPGIQETVSERPSLEQIFETMRNMGGLAFLLTALLNVGKRFKLIKDGQASNYSLAFQTLTLVALVTLQLTGKADLVPVIDEKAGAIATVLNSVLVLVYQIYVARFGHNEVLAGMPAIGYSYSGRQAGDQMVTEISEEVNTTVGNTSISEATLKKVLSRD